jgi:hypothetical protein
MLFMLFVWGMGYVPIPVWFAVVFVYAGCVALVYQIAKFVGGY